MIVLGIESSCDETAAAVVRRTARVLADVVSSQVALHAPYGGVVPELALRVRICRTSCPVVERRSRAARRARRFDGIAVTNGPGLVGRAARRRAAAKALAVSRELAAGRRQPSRRAPAGGVPAARSGASRRRRAIRSSRSSVSGGTHGDLRSALGLRHRAARADARRRGGRSLRQGGQAARPRLPGRTASVDRLAQQGDAERVALCRGRWRASSLEFSFSGLKTAVAQHVARARGRSTSEHRRCLRVVSEQRGRRCWSRKRWPLASSVAYHGSC